jgi:hypothetical protein
MIIEKIKNFYVNKIQTHLTCLNVIIITFFLIILNFPVYLHFVDSHKTNPIEFFQSLNLKVENREIHRDEKQDNSADSANHDTIKSLEKKINRIFKKANNSDSLLEFRQIHESILTGKNKLKISVNGYTPGGYGNRYLFSICL